MDTGQLTAEIKKRAAQLGFEACRIAQAETLPADRFEEWLAHGYQGRMDYLVKNREKRLNPNLILPGVRSIVCVALLYGHPAEPRENDGTRLSGVVSRYAQGEDYHRVMSARLEALFSFLQELRPGTTGKTYIDTGPILEKEWAARAGIGWQAKNTNVLSRQLGSWFFLGELLVDCVLNYDLPVQEHCGTCTRCIDACPTGALEPYVLDSRRCISYLTIELREDIPQDLRKGMGKLIYGCDICQDVCPWNRQSPLSLVEQFRPQPESAETDLDKLSQMTPNQFSARYNSSPVKRTKWRGLMRNVAVALGNSASEAAIAPLARLLESEDAMVRRHAAWGLARLGTPRAFQLLTDRREREKDEPTLKTLEELLRLQDDRESSVAPATRS